MGPRGIQHTELDMSFSVATLGYWTWGRHMRWDFVGAGLAEMAEGHGLDGCPLPNEFPETQRPARRGGGKNVSGINMLLSVGAPGHWTW
jgi:hypothetical protein